MMASALHRANEIEEAAHERARAIAAAAEDAAQRSRAEASRRIEATGGQFNELLRLKENLVVAMRGVVGEFQEALSRVERGESLFGRPAAAVEAPAAPPPPAAPYLDQPYPPAATIPPAVPPQPTQAAPPPPPPPPPAVPEAPPAYSPPPAYAPPPRPLAPPPPVAATPPPQYAPPPEPVATEELLFETHVELDAGPFPDFASLSTFERAIARLPRVADVYVRRLADDRAVIELALTEPTPLLATMRENLPYDVQVQSASRTNVVVNVFAHSPAPH
jgi:hypothetical protein